MRLGILYSSGKDSTFTLHYYRNQAWDVACLLCLLPKNPDSLMFQNPLKELVRAQAASLNIPVIFKETEGKERQELEDLTLILQEAKKAYHIDGIGVGALASDYQHVRVNHACEALGLKTYAPLWHKEQLRLLQEMVSADFDIRMTRVAAMGLGKEWLGKRLTLPDLEKLHALEKSIGFHPAGEGGEFETIVLDGPGFTKPITIAYETRMESDERGELVIKKVKLK